jgi:hypothetical protein
LLTLLIYQEGKRGDNFDGGGVVMASLKVLECVMAERESMSGVLL